MWKTLAVSAGLLCSVSFAYFEIDLRNFEEIDGDHSIMDFSQLKIKRVNKTKIRGVSGSIVYSKDIDNSYTTECHVYVKQGGEYRKMPYRLPPQKFCDFHESDKVFYPEIAEVSNLPNPFECPVKKGNYTIHDFVPTLKGLPVAMIGTGDYAADLHTFLGDKIISTVKLYASIIQI